MLENSIPNAPDPRRSGRDRLVDQRLGRRVSGRELRVERVHDLLRAEAGDDVVADLRDHELIGKTANPLPLLDVFLQRLATSPSVCASFTWNAPQVNVFAFSICTIEPLRRSGPPKPPGSPASRRARPCWRRRTCRARRSPCSPPRNRRRPPRIFHPPRSCPRRRAAAPPRFDRNLLLRGGRRRTAPGSAAAAGGKAEDDEKGQNGRNKLFHFKILRSGPVHGALFCYYLRESRPHSSSRAFARRSAGNFPQRHRSFFVK